MRVLLNLPLLLLPLIAYNVLAFGLAAPDAAATWAAEILRLPMMSGVTWTMDRGDAIVVAGLVLLFFEILKSTRIGSHSILDHLLSTLVFVLYLVEFLLVPAAATSVFFTLMAICFVDVIAGFSVSIRTASRDVTFGRDP